MDGTPYRIDRILENGDCRLERKSDLALIQRSKKELLEKFKSGQLILDGVDINSKGGNITKIDLAGLPPEEQKYIMRKYQYVKKAKTVLGNKPQKTHLKKVIRAVAKKLNDKNAPSVSSVYRWWREWSNCQYDMAALRGKVSGPKKTRKFKGVINDEIQSVFEEIYLTKQKMTKQDVYDVLIVRIKDLNIAREYPLRIPSRSTFYRIVMKANSYDVMAAREGKRIADKHFRATGMGANPKYILERVEVDHTPLDVMVYNPVTGLADGRPNLTLLLDRYSRIPLGFEIGFEAPSELSVMRALRNSILPKNSVNNDYPLLENDWPAFGIPIMLICDNGLEFHALQLRRMCAELDMDLQFCPKLQPEYKGAVERFLGTLNRQVSHTLPGTTFSNIKQRGDYISTEQTKITLDQLKELVHEWIIDIYNQKTHRVTQRTPYSLWNEGLKLVEPKLPESVDKLNLILTREDERVLTHQGVEFDSLFYNSSELGVLRTRSNNTYKVKFRHDPEDIGFIWVFDDRIADYLKVPCTDYEYANGLTRRQHKLIRANILAAGKKDEDTESLLISKEKFRKKIVAMSNHELVRERKKAARDNSEKLQKSAWSANKIQCRKTTKKAKDWADDDIPSFDEFQNNDGDE